MNVTLNMHVPEENGLELHQIPAGHLVSVVLDQYGKRGRHEGIGLKLKPNTYKGETGCFIWLIHAGGGTNQSPMPCVPSLAMRFRDLGEANISLEKPL